MNTQLSHERQTLQGFDESDLALISCDWLLIDTAQPGSYAILRLPAVLRARGRSRSTHYLDIERGLFTHPVSIGARAVGWPEHEVVALNSARIAGASVSEIRALVQALEARRRKGA